MSRVEILITIHLLSDTVLFDGNRISDREAEFHYINQDGYPFLPAPSIMGLLRENIENSLGSECGQKSTYLQRLFGEDERFLDRDKRLLVEDFRLCDTGEQQLMQTSCFRVVKKKPDFIIPCLRLCRGLSFTGRVCCHSDDFERVDKALRAIKGLGYMRDKGFGQINVLTRILHRCNCDCLNHRDGSKCVMLNQTNE